MKRVLLTGASGFIGRQAIVPLLEKGYEVHAVSRFAPPKDLIIENVVWHEADLLNSDAVKGLTQKIKGTHLLHFAWYMEHGKVWNAEENLDWLRATINLVQHFAGFGGKNIVAAGTCYEYDFSQNAPFNENFTPSNPNTLYGVSKYSLYLVLKKFALLSDLSFAWGRIFLSFGKYEYVNRLFPSVINSLLNNKEAKTSHGNQIRDFLEASDIAEAFVALLESDVQGIVNIGSGKGVKLRDLIEEIAAIIGKPELLRIGALPASKTEPPEIVADAARLREEVGWKKEFNLREKMEETIRWWKNNHENTINSE